MAAASRNIRREHRRVIANRLRRPRIFRDRENPLEVLPEDEIFRRYRFRPVSIYFILGLLPDLSAPTQRNMPLPPLLQVLCALRFLATGSVHLLVSESVRVSRSTAGRCIRRVCQLIADLVGRFVRFPTGRDAARTKNEFAAIAGFPNVLGCIDGTFIKVMKPTANEQDYVNRKGFHALNVQMCCDARFRITSLNASWPGSVHDSRIFRQSALCTQFENGVHNGFLLGDSGYPCRYFLMTPFLNPSTAAEEKFNRSLSRTRVMIEQSFGILKRRFQVLHVPIRAKPPRAVIYITASVTLHNIGIERGDIINSDNLVINEEEEPMVAMPERQDGVAIRRHLVTTFFN